MIKIGHKTITFLPGTLVVGKCTIYFVIQNSDYGTDNHGTAIVTDRSYNGISFSNANFPIDWTLNSDFVIIESQ